MRMPVFDPGTSPGSMTLGLGDVPDISQNVILILKPADDQRSASQGYKAGDVIEVLDGSKYSGGPVCSLFQILRVTGVTKDMMAGYMTEWRDVVTGAMTRRRLFNVNTLSLPATTQLELTTSRYASVSWAVLRTSLMNKNTARSQ